MLHTAYKPQPFFLSNLILLFFDIFYKNNKIYLLMPIYNVPAPQKQITLIVNNKIMNLSESYIKDSNEPILVYVYEYITPPNTVIKVSVKLINNMINSYNIQHIYTLADQSLKKNSNNFLALTTLFKYDYYLFPLFYNYYKEQGVQHFYMYYNGIITPEIRKIFDKHDVTLVEWNFHYWNPHGVKYPHHAQMGQMHHALYKYGKGIYDYMIFCDLDEYLHIPKNKAIESTTPDVSLPRYGYRSNSLKQFIINNPDTDIFGFCNYWANTLDDNLPSTPYLPKKFLAVSEPCEYKERSKNIYKVSFINTIGVHQVGDELYNSPNALSMVKSITDLSMYHFYKWSSKNRVIDNCTCMVDLS
jgi:hypothetical protein